MPLPPTFSREMALFLDFDGTLVEIAEEPGDVKVAPDLVRMLEMRSADLDFALTIVSGRPLTEIDAFLSPLRLPAAGLHGLEYRRSTQEAIERFDTGTDIAVLRARLAQAELNVRGITVEDKGIALAVHFRKAPSQAEFARRALEAAICDLHTLHLVPGKMVIEAKPNIANKGIAVKTMMLGLPFSGRIPVFVGDDLTDEDGMKAAAALGGFGIKVGEGQTAARWRLPDVRSVHAWLAG